MQGIGFTYLSLFEFGVCFRAKNPSRTRLSLRLCALERSGSSRLLDPRRVRIDRDGRILFPDWRFALAVGLRNLGRRVVVARTARRRLPLDRQAAVQRGDTSACMHSSR